MQRPTRIRRKRSRGWRNPPGAVYVGRPTRWGNPFAGDDLSEVVAAFRRLIRGEAGVMELVSPDLRIARNAHPETLQADWAAWARKNVTELRGKDLICWCPLDGPCHADVLLELANPEGI